MSKDMNSSKELSEQLDRRLALIHQLVSRTHDAVFSQHGCSKSIHNHPTWHSIEESEWGQEKAMQQWNIEGSASSLDEPQSNGIPTHTGRRGPHGRRLHPNSITHNSDRAYAILKTASRPVSPFEQSPSYLPEMYSTYQRLPVSTLMLMRSFERLETLESRINMYQFLYLESPRKWCRLCVSLEIYPSSTYWRAMKISKEGCKSQEMRTVDFNAQISSHFLTQIQESLATLEGVEEDDSLEFQMIGPETISLLNPKCINEFRKHSAGSKIAHRDLLNFLDDLRCPRYIESDVTQIQLLDPPNRFTSCLNGDFVYEIKFTGSIPDADLVYTIKVLHCLGGRAGFARLVGVVTDAAGKQLKSYLVDFPHSYRRVAQLTQDGHIPWRYREEWARQLLMAVSDAHAHGFVIGKFGFSSPILVDSTDCIRFWEVKEVFDPELEIGCYYPPEFHYLNDTSTAIPEKTPATITTKTDLYRLGMLLWTLAENVPCSRVSPVCMREGCDQTSDGCSKESHLRPIALPELPESIPQYYKDIVSACRAANPEDRPSAWNLLNRFPRSRDALTSLSIYSSHRLRPELASINPMEKGMRGLIHCDICGRSEIQHHFFHCNVCRAGDFDICPTCYDFGTHCFDNEHLLVEISKQGIFSKAEKYHGSPDIQSKREIVEL